MSKFNSITAILTLIIFTLTGEAQDPILLRLTLSSISALMLSALYCGFTEDAEAGPTIILLSVALIAATLADPDPSTLQVLLAFIGAPIITAIAIRSEQEKKHETETVVEPTPAQKR